jgi:bacterioferritin-associated ferredoxin
MFVCVCNAVTESQVRQAVDEGAVTLADLQARLNVASHCGCCTEQAGEVLQKRLLEIAAASQSPRHPAGLRSAAR